MIDFKTISKLNVSSIADTLQGNDEERHAPISISVYLDDSAPADIVGRVRNLFASAASHVRETVGYLGNAQAVPNPTDDMAVIVAGTHPDAGKLASEIRAAGVPALVITTMPAAMERVAQEAGFPVPAEDVVAPQVEAGVQEPYEMTDELMEEMKDAIGAWIIGNCSERSLAFATAFPFVCRPLALDAIMLTSIENGIVGALCFIPVANWPIMTLNQIKMVLQIAAAYGLPLDGERIKEIVAVAAGGYGCRVLANNVAGSVPVIGALVKASVGFGGTQVMGRVALEYFENGAGPAGLGKVVANAGEVAMRGAEAVQAAANGVDPATAAAEKAAQAEAQAQKSTREQVKDAAELWGGRAVKAGTLAARIAVPMAKTAGTAGLAGAKGIADVGAARAKAKAASVLGTVAGAAAGGRS